MEVLVGSTLGIEVSSSSAFARERAAQVGDVPETGFRGGRSAKLEEDDDDSSSGKSSSIGVPGDSDEEEADEDGVLSSEDAKRGGLGTMASLEDSLPIKRGLSNHFSGKSKSFNNLSEAMMTGVVSSAKDLEKPEHPFNKKRRILRRWSRDYSLLSSAKSMPLFPLIEEDDDDDNARDLSEGDDGDGGAEAVGSSFSGRHERKHSVFKSSSCFALSDLHEEDEEEEEEED